MVEVIASLYSSQSEIERLIGENGASIRADDTGDNEAESGIWDDIIAEATDTVNLYTTQYVPAGKANNLWIRKQASWIGAYLLTLRRGDPGLFQDRYEQVIAQLERVKTGDFQVPRLATTSDLTPALSNYSIDDRFRKNKTRVQPSTSTGGQGARQDLDPQQPYGYYEY